MGRGGGHELREVMGSQVIDMLWAIAKSLAFILNQTESQLLVFLEQGSRAAE